MAFQGLVRAPALAAAGPHNALSVLAPRLWRACLPLRRLQPAPQRAAGPARPPCRPRGLACRLGHNPFTYMGEEDELALPACGS